MQRGIVVLIISLICSSPAFAKHKKTHHPFHRHQAEYTSKHSRHVRHHGVRYTKHGGSDRPFAWCGWWMRKQVDHDPGPDYNLARNWIHWGHAIAAQIGAIVVWPHHVGKITGGYPGHWIVTSGNDGNRVRSRERSVSGAIAFRG